MVKVPGTHDSMLIEGGLAFVAVTCSGIVSTVAGVSLEVFAVPWVKFPIGADAFAGQIRPAKVSKMKKLVQQEEHRQSKLNLEAFIDYFNASGVSRLPNVQIGKGFNLFSPVAEGLQCN
jgi:hypothetical protein